MYFIEWSNFKRVKNTSVGFKNTLSRGHILLGVRDTLYGGLKYFSGGQILIGVNIFIGWGLKYFIEGANFQYQS